MTIKTGGVSSVEIRKQADNELLLQCGPLTDEVTALCGELYHQIQYETLWRRLRLFLNLPTLTPTATRTPVPTVDPSQYEPNDSCEQATFIPSDGTLQVHNFAKVGDEDWLYPAAMLDV